jgi:hypothetical protein
MKTSNKLAIAAVILILAAMFFYDLKLKAAYLSGDYKNPFRDFVAMNFKNFNSIKLNASTASNIVVKQGPFSVKIEPNGNNYVKVAQTGSTLNIDVAFSGNYQNPRYDYVMVITCPNLVNFDADAKYMAGDLPVTDTLAGADFKWRPSIIRGFTMDSLSITAKHASNIILTQNNIKSLKAVIGINDGSASDMTIGISNRFEKADLTVLNKSRLQILEASIPNLKYEMADSAKLILTGVAKKLINKQ